MKVFPFDTNPLNFLYSGPDRAVFWPVFARVRSVFLLNHWLFYAIFWKSYLGDIVGISWAYLGHILGISWAYLGHILGISWTYLVHILGISWVYGQDPIFARCPGHHDNPFSSQ